MPTPFDDDKLHEECGVFGVIGVQDAATFVALGLHALQHRGQEAGGIVAYAPEAGFSSARRFGYVRDNFTSPALMETLPGALAIGHVRYSTAGSKGATQIRDVQPLFAEFAMGGAAIAHNGNLTNALALREELIERGSIFQSGSDTECIIHLMARSIQKTIPERMKDALRRVEGAFSIVAMTRSKLIGVRDPLGVRPLMLGRLGRRLGALLRDLRPRHHRRRLRARDRARRDGDRHRRGHRELLPLPAAAAALLHLREGLLLPPRQRDRRPVGLRDPPPHRRRARPRGPGRGRPRLPGARLRHPGRDRLQPAVGHPLRHGDHPQPVHGPHLHRADRADPQHGRAAEAQRQPRGDRRQARRARRRQRRPRHHQPQDPRDGDGRRRRRGALPHRLAADPVALLLRRRHPRPRQAPRRRR